MQEPDMVDMWTLRELRNRYEITQAQAASLIYVSLRQYQKWEAGTVQMHPAYWELFQIKIECDPPEPKTGKHASRVRTRKKRIAK